MPTTRISKRLRLSLRTLTALIVLAVLIAVFAPYLYGEFDAIRGHGAIVGAMPSGPVAGRWVDDYFVVEPIDSTTFAIGEPRYYQGNYSYLIIGTVRAVLFDAGTGTRDITPVVRSLTSLPITVIPSHLHYDHVGALGRFDSTALIDDPSLRARINDSQLTLGRYEFLGFYDRLKTPTFHVDEWWASGSTVDIGDRRLQVISTPGHTPTSVALYDETRRQLFLGDFMYPGELYAFLPAASRGAYLSTTRRLLSILAPDTRLYTAHMQDAPAPVRAPVLEMADLKALEATLVAIQEGTLASSGFYPRIFPVRGPITFATGWPWNNR
jgi:hydroxyacylglutathione hydrolase